MGTGFRIARVSDVGCKAEIGVSRQRLRSRTQRRLIKGRAASRPRAQPDDPRKNHRSLARTVLGDGDRARGFRVQADSSQIRSPLGRRHYLVALHGRGDISRAEADPRRLYATGGNATIYYDLGVTEHSQGSTTVMGVANLVMATGNLTCFRQKWTPVLPRKARQNKGF